MRRNVLVTSVLILASCSGPPSSSKGPDKIVVIDSNCGNGVIDEGETCDGADTGGQMCPTGGTIACAADCRSLELSGCNAPETCGNGQLDDDEQCDGAELGETTCATQGRGGGALACAANCLGFDLSGCADATNNGDDPVCGDGMLEGDEACEVGDISGCSDLGYDFGDASCAADCSGWEESTCGRSGTHFEASHTRWSLPQEGGGVEGKWWTLNREAFTPNTWNWSTLDINGDGRVDLVSTNRVNAEDTKEPHGWPNDAHWVVFLNNGAGFDAAPTRWNLPQEGGGVDGKWWTLTREGFTAGAWNWSTLDINGDGLPDLVSTNRVNAEDTKEPHGWPSDAHWLVFLNNGTGFDAAPTRWDIPQEGGGVDGKWWTLTREGFTAGTWNWSTLDIDGDRLPDLVSTNRVNAEDTKEPHGWPSDAHWLVFRNNGTGFDAAPTRWDIPQVGGGVEGKWWTLYREAFSPNTWNWSTLDINGDGLPDLVSTNRVNAEETKEPHGWPNDGHWLVFLNNGIGFDAAPTRWNIPQEGGGVDGKWWSLNREAFSPNTWNWSTLDINGDGLPDLVSTNRVNAEDTKEPHGWPSDAHWLIFLNDGNGFDAAPTRWDLPQEGGGADGKWWTLYREAFTAGTWNWSALDIDGDGRVDLVSTNRVNAEETKEPHGWPDDAHWRVFRNVP